MSEVLEVEMPVAIPRLDRAQIEGLLPHRGEILFLHSLRLHDDKHFSGTARWNAGTMGLEGHFPELSVVPAVFLVEAVAQLAGAGTLATRDAREYASPHIGVLVSIRKCVFRQPVPVGVDVSIDVQLRQIGARMVSVEASALVGKLPAAAIEVVLGEALIDSLTAALGGRQ